MHNSKLPKHKNGLLGEASMSHGCNYFVLGCDTV